MKLALSRSRSELLQVLMDKNSTGPETAYWVFSNITQDRWENLTILAPGFYGWEFNKTFGHYHSSSEKEVYRVAYGDGILVLQRKHLEGGQVDYERVDQVILIKATAGDELIIPPEYGHSWSNVGMGPVLLLDNWRSGHQEADYQPIAKQNGLAYFLTLANGQITPIANPRYRDLPPPVWMSTAQWRVQQSY